MTDAYNYVSEGHRSPEIEQLKRIDRFGLEAVTGRRVFLFHEFTCLRAAEKVVSAYHSRLKAVNQVEWAASNPGLAQLLFEVEKLFEE